MSDNIRGVGLLLFTEVKDVLWAVLQRRGTFDLEKSVTEKRLIPETWPNLCQLSAHGDIEAVDVNGITAVIRECREELGDAVADLMIATWDKSVFEMGKSHSKNGIFINYAMFIQLGYLNTIRLHPSSGGLKLVSEQMLQTVSTVSIADLALLEEVVLFPGRPFSQNYRDKAQATTDQIATQIVMLPDDFEALQQGFVIAKAGIR